MRKVSESAKALNWPARALAGTTEDGRVQVVKATKGKLKGKPQPDANLRDTENVPLSEDVETYFKREVLPHAPDARIDHDKTKVGYEKPPVKRCVPFFALDIAIKSVE